MFNESLYQGRQPLPRADLSVRAESARLLAISPSVAANARGVEIRGAA